MSLIEEWLSSMVSIIVTGVLMTVDSECSVAVSSLSEAQCQPPMINYSTTTTDSTAAIIGGSVVAVIALTITAAVIITFIQKNGGNVNKQKA